MTYVFIKTYNPAYDYFLTRFFERKGIDLGAHGDSPTFASLRKKMVALGDKQVGAGRLYLDYLSHWRLHPESRPSFDYFLARTFDDGKLTMERLETLQAELPSSKGKIVLSQDDVAADVFNYYKRIVREPLRKDVERRASVLRILDYFGVDDSAALPHSKGVDRREFERAVRDHAKGLVSRLDGLSAKKVSRDVSSVLGQHTRAGHQMEPMGVPTEAGLRPLWCEHDSDFVRLFCSQQPGESEPHWTLQPSRGYGVIEDGWKDLIFPEYKVLRESDE